MQFYSPEHFIFLWSIPVLLGIFWLTQMSWRKRIAKIGNRDLVLTKLIPNFDASAKIKKFSYLILALIFATIALARPQWGEEKKKIQRKGIDVIFMLDTSLSMLAEDVKPSRLEKSKMEIKSILRQLKGDRVGIIAFAGSSFLQSPLTLDYSAFQLFLDAINTGYIPDPGTSIAQALEMGIKSFPSDNLKHKAIILLTDGEDLEGGVEEMIKPLQSAGIRVYSLGFGTEKGDPIPLKNEARQKAGFKKDREGQIVITKLNKGILEKIAKETGGIYFTSTPGEQEVPIIMKHMDSIEKKQFKENMITEREDHYQLFLFLAFLMLCFEQLVRKTKKEKKQNSEKILSVFILFCWLFHSGFLESSKSLNNKANEDFKAKKYQSAVDNYRKAQVKSPDDPTVRYNLGSTLYQTQNYAQAAKELQKSIETAKKEDKQLLAKALYNYGNTQYRLGNFEKAIESYQKALDLAPDDKDAKYNLEFIQNKKNAFDKKNDQQKKQDQQKQNKNQPQPKNQQQNQQQQNQQQNQNQQNQDQKQQNQDQKDNQNKQDQQQNQQQNQNDQQKDQDKKDQDQNEQNQPKPDQGKEDQQPSKPDQQEGEKQNPDQKDQGKEDQKQDQQEENKEQEQKPEEENDQEKPQPKDGEEEQKDAQANEQPGQGQSKRSLQGQMPINDALRILEALKDSEKDLQDLRKPPTPRQPRRVEKDW